MRTFTVFALVLLSAVTTNANSLKDIVTGEVVESANLLDVRDPEPQPRVNPLLNMAEEAELAAREAADGDDDDGSARCLPGQTVNACRPNRCCPGRNRSCCRVTGDCCPAGGHKCCDGICFNERLRNCCKGGFTCVKARPCCFTGCCQRGRRCFINNAGNPRCARIRGRELFEALVEADDAEGDAEDAVSPALAG